MSSTNTAALRGGKAWFGHPRGLSTLFFTEMWERFSYYGMRALLILFLVATVQNGGFGLTDKKAAAIYGLYTAGVYLMALPGGWIADRIFGQRRAVFIGGCVIAAGHFSMAVPTVPSFYLGLCLIVIGTGLLKPNVSAMVGDLYPEGGARRDSGFSFFYMGINTGAFIGALRLRLSRRDGSTGTSGSAPPASAWSSASSSTGWARAISERPDCRGPRPRTPSPGGVPCAAS